MTKKIYSFIENILHKLWYKNKLSPLLFCFYPASYLVKTISSHRYLKFVKNKKRQSFQIPIIVIGNITIGGTGKTTLLTSIVEYLKTNNFNPGIISRGYKSNIKTFPARVFADSNPYFYGDEPVLLAKTTKVPVVIAPDRKKAAEFIYSKTNCNIILSDDGLQHYNLPRHGEIAVIDGSRGLGNSFCIPAGPLRESSNRLKTVDIIVSKAKTPQNFKYKTQLMQLHMPIVKNLFTNENIPIMDFVKLNPNIHAIAGIGNPELFFTFLKTSGFSIKKHIFRDHHQYSFSEIDFNDNLPIVMTAKDSIKCQIFAKKNMWSVPVEGVLSKQFWILFDQMLKKIYA